MQSHGLIQGFLKLLRRVMYFRVRSQIVNLDLKELNIQGEEPVFYVTRYRSLADSLVIDHECEIADLPRPLETFEITENSQESSQKNLKIQHRVIPLTRPGLALGSSTTRYFSDRLRSLVQFGIDNPDFEAKLVPVSVFWGRSPRVEGSFWQVILSDSWSVPGMLRKLMMVIFKGRQTHVQFSAPYSLRQLISDEPTPDRVISKTHRLIRNRIRRQREAFIGPDLSHRRTLVKSLLEQPSVVQLIQREAEKANVKPAKIQAKAYKYANEIAADYSHVVIRCLHILLRWLWTKLYDGVVLHNEQNLQNLAAEHAIVYVPSHRSHVDYLLLSYVLYELGLVPPHIAAGINLNLPIIGPILRRGGAFFMRRSFRDNPLYATIFSEYIHRVLDRGFAIEYFIEGGRSRTGKQLLPRPGMLRMTLQSYAQSNNKSLMFVPVNFCYERLFEGKSYLGELRGEKKRKETLLQFFQSLKRIKENFGKVHVTFGEPISALEFLQSQGHNNPKDIIHLENHAFKQLSLNLGLQISNHINQAAFVHPIALLSLVLLSCPKHALSEHQLLAQLKLYKAYLSQKSPSSASIVSDLKPETMIAYGESMDYLCRHPHSLGDILFLTEKQAHFLNYFKNNVLHFVALPSLICLLCKNQRNISRSKLLIQIKK